MDVCDVCKQPFEAGVSCVWRAGSEVAREDMGSSGGFSGPVRTYKVIGGDLRGICAPAAFFAFFFSLYSLVDVVKHLRGSRSPGFIHDVTKPIVSAKALEIGLDKLFPPE